MNEREHRHGGSGFLLGVIVGGCLMYLLTTKSGKKMLKNFIDGALDAVENVGDIGNLEKIEEEYAGESSFAPASETAASAGEENGHNPVTRFFKGIKKK